MTWQEDAQKKLDYFHWVRRNVDDLYKLLRGLGAIDVEACLIARVKMIVAVYERYPDTSANDLRDAAQDLKILQVMHAIDQL